jgi:hypothetical protein
MGVHLSYTATTATTSAASKLAANNRRTMLRVENKGSADVYYRCDGTNPTATTGETITSGAIHTYELPGEVPVGAVHMLAASGTQNVLLTEAGE